MYVLDNKGNSSKSKMSMADKRRSVANFMR